MAREDRTGNRTTRKQRAARRIPEMGYYLVVTDTEATERCYFTGLHKSLPSEIQHKLVIKVAETKTQNMIQKCLELTAYESQYRIPWIVFYRDEVVDFDKIISEAEKAGIHVGWSNPCFEIWMYAYFGNMPVIHESWTCCSRFGEIYEKETGQKYSKADEDMYRRLIEKGDETKALAIAKQKYEQCEKKDIQNRPRCAHVRWYMNWLGRFKLKQMACDLKFIGGDILDNQNRAKIVRIWQQGSDLIW